MSLAYHMLFLFLLYSFKANYKKVVISLKQSLVTSLQKYIRSE